MEGSQAPIRSNRSISSRTKGSTIRIHFQSNCHLSGSSPNQTTTNFRVDDVSVSVTTGPVATPPSFTTQPASQAVNAGQSGQFTAVAAGSPSPTYQWQR